MTPTAESHRDCDHACQPFNKEEPIIFAGTLRVHHGEHHKVYVEKRNDMLNGKMRRDS
jgi:superoxide dismutase